MLRNAVRLLGEGKYDLADFNAEYAAQLHVKAVLY
ncbi:HEPN domain-containing protein [Staphylothermus marinus]|nr:HEPN domain-containing protein [Staphylothermus marinus]